MRTETLPIAEEVFIGLAATSHLDGTLTTAEFSNVSVTGSVGQWYQTDIGDVLAAGSTEFISQNQIRIEASGNDIFGARDEFHFAYQHLVGDGEITARVDSLTATHPWAKAGVMIRERLTSDASNVMMLLSAQNGTRSQIRTAPAGRSSESIADEMLVDALDKRLTNGLFKLRYPYDPPTMMTQRPRHRRPTQEPTRAHHRRHHLRPRRALRCARSQHRRSAHW